MPTSDTLTKKITPMNDSPQQPPSSENDPMAQILRKVEMQQMQLKLEVQFKRNMELFKVKAPEIYNEYINYKPEELQLSFDKAGFLNLVNSKLNNKPVYSDDPEKFSLKQAEQFTKTPVMSVISFTNAKQHNPNHIHVEIMNNLIDEYREMAQAKPHSNVPIGLMLMTGCGLGHHLPHLIETLDIYNLVIFDPHKDSFYAALHVIDWVPILEYFFQPNRMLKLFIGVKPEEAMADMKLLTDKIGLYNLVYTYIYRHFNSKKEEEFVEMYRKEFHLAASATGFFDDEQTSFAHTINNLNHSVNWFRHSMSDKKLPPAFVLGNGPSLDKHVEYIKRNHKNAIIFSCGTTIGSLCKIGLKPDFHVEMERVSNQTDWIINGTDAEFRKGITLLCLNTAPPNMIEIFDEICMAKKPNDAGESLLDEILPNSSGVHRLALCNPTVANAGLSFAIHMGFKEIYLMGVDLGTRPDGAHHSQFSLYTDLEKKTKQKGHSAFEKKDSDYLVPGNFGGEVYTNPILHGTRSSLEILLRHIENTRNDITCYNSNDGALINGAKPIALEDLPELPQVSDKSLELDKIRENSFYFFESPGIDADLTKEKYLKNFFDIRGDLVLKKDIKNAKEMIKAFNKIYFTLRDRSKTNGVTELLLRGSLNGYFTLLLKNCLHHKSGEKFNIAFKLGRSAYMSFLKRAYQMMETIPLKHDDTPDRVLVKLKKGEPLDD
ncbi:MAG: DUF115 domain-containing protein [Agarilytica sp.]